MPSYSIGKQSKKASFMTNNIAPGVGAYKFNNDKQTTKSQRMPVCIIGRQERIKTQKHIGPGPTAYNLTKVSFFNDKQKGIYMIGKPNIRVKSQGPGPAKYSLPKFDYSKKYSFGLRPSQKNYKLNFPGPTVYDPQKIKNTTAISFQKSKRPSVDSNPQVDNPGPGYYSTNNLNQTRNKFTFSKKLKNFQDLKELNQKNKIPAPNQYKTENINIIKREVAAIKFGNARRVYLEDQIKNPGPGAYSPTDSPRKRSPVATIGNSPKQITCKIKIPGPGAYDVDIKNTSRKQSSVIIGKQSRQDKTRKIYTQAGPGSYNIDYQERGRSYSISGRHQHQKKIEFPGPITYHPKYQSFFRRTQMAIIGKDRKFHEAKQIYPGPGSYCSVELKKKSKTFYFPKQNRKQNINSNPGPGSYQIKSLIGQNV